jgi:thiamine biosynthesis protein ThiI
MKKQDLPHLLMIRLSGDISTKADRTRNQFVKVLRGNLKDVLKQADAGYKIETTRGRLFVKTDDLSVIEPLSRVFGIQGISVVEKVAWETLEDIVEVAVRHHGDMVVGKKFAVRAKRGGHRQDIPFGSREVQIAVGQALLERSAGVDLKNPEVTVHVEFHKDFVLNYTAEQPGAGGLPIGVSSRALSLISGGFDSPVASWMMLRRGIDLDYVFFNLGGAPHRQGVLQVLDVLIQQWTRGTRPKLYEVDLRPMVEHLRETVDERLWQVILKRLMVRAAHAIAQNEGHQALLTGEAVSQVSSQTLQNLAVIDRTVPMLILRPLVGHNKREIIELSKRVGTHDISAMAEEYCALTTHQPVTKLRLVDAEEAEAPMDFSKLRAAVDAKITYNITNLRPEELNLDTPSVDTLPEGALLIDLREARSFRGWHHPDALHLPYFEALKTFSKLPRDHKIVLVCKVGLKSSGLAEAMRKIGYDAVNFKGGISALLKYTADQTDPLLAELMSPV